MKNYTIRGMVTLAVLMCFLSAVVGAAEGPKGQRDRKTLGKTAGEPLFTLLNISNFTSWLGANSNSNTPPGLGGDGGYYPRGTRWVIFMDGLVWGGKVFVDSLLTTPPPGTQDIRVGGATYNVGLVPGAIVGTGAAANPEDPDAGDVRIYRVRRDYAQMSDADLTRDAAEVNEVPQIDVTDAMKAEVLAQYDTDWKNWPVAKGAPYIERNGTPGYQAPPDFSNTFTVDDLIAGNYDEPGLAGADPNSPADQVVWTVANDLNSTATQGLYGSDPMGLELQITRWGYKRADALGQLYFTKYKFINKGGVTVTTGGGKGSYWIDSMYVAQWSDPDLGLYTNDLCGCDTTLSLGFVYNGAAVDAEFAKYDLAPPAAGYDFLAGPIVQSAGDTAVFDLKLRPGFRNLPMTGFAWFAAGSDISDPPFTYEGTLRWWKMLRGFRPDPSDQADRYYPGTGPGGLHPDAFPLSGDPVRKSGAIDGLGTPYSFPAGDRRIVLTSGPFVMSPGDTQEVVVGTVGGIGGDRFSSIAVMKYNDRAVQQTYDNLFRVPAPPAAPDVKVAELDARISLEWGSNTTRINVTENTIAQPGNYVFEGYHVYQLPTQNSTLSDGVRIVTYDRVNSLDIIDDEVFVPELGAILTVPVVKAENSGIKRYFEFDRDYVNDVARLYNGQEYYLAVTAYSVGDPGVLPRILESSPQILTVRAKKPFGQVFTYGFEDTITVNHVGPSDGLAIPIVKNPEALTGNTYTITFDSLNRWDLTNTTTGQVKLSDISNQTGDDDVYVVDGFLIKVIGAPNNFKRFWAVANGAGAIDPPDQAAFAFNNSGFPTVDGLPPNGVNDRPTTSQQTNGSRWGIHTGYTGGPTDASYAFFTTRVTQGGARWPRIVPNDFEIRFTYDANAYGLEPGAFTGGPNVLMQVPFELWYTGVNTPTDASDDYRLWPYLIDSDGDGQFTISTIDHPISGGDNDPETDWFYWVVPVDKTPGESGYNAILASIQADVANHAYLDPTIMDGDVMRRMVLVNFNGGSVSDPSYPANLNATMPEQGTVFRIVSTKPNTVNDSFTWVATKPTSNATTQRASADLVGVFPNPYYAFNAAETNRLIRFVTFNNLPGKATIRIFNLAGQLVRTINKDNTSQFQRWDLTNEDNFPVASGMYIAHVEMNLPAGETYTKVLKFAVIQEQEILDVY